MTALIELEDIYSYKGEAFNPSDLDITDEQYQYLIEAVSAKVEKYCNRTFDITSYTEYYDGMYTPFIVLEQYPLVSVSGVWLVDEKQDVSYTYDMDYIIPDYDTGLIKNNSNFPNGYKNVRISYTAGYSEIPDDLKLAIVKMVINEAQNNSINSSMKSERLGDYSYTLKDDIEIDNVTMNLLNTYKSF